MLLHNITPLILTFNEDKNLGRTLSQLFWAKRIVIVDSFSTDATLEIASLHPQVELYQRKFDTHATQWNYGIDKIDSEWVLSLDADYVVSDELIAELSALPEAPSTHTYFTKFKYCVFGKPLKRSILPPRQTLFRKGKATYIDDGHTQRLKTLGASSTLSSYIYHDDRKALSRWLWAQDRYMVIEVKKLLVTPKAELSFGDRLRKQKVFAPFVVMFYCLILKGGLLDGWAGWYYALQRLLAEVLLTIHLIEAEKAQMEYKETTTTATAAVSSVRSSAVSSVRSL